MPRKPQSETTAAAFSALKYVAGKQADRQQLVDGTAYKIELSISGRCAGNEFRRQLACTLMANHATEQAGRSPGTRQLLAHILALLPTIEARRLANALPEEIHEQPAADDLAAADHLLERCRGPRTIKAGAVTAAGYSLE